MSTKDWDKMSPAERKKYLQGTSFERYANIDEIVTKSWDELSHLIQWSIVIAKSTR